MIKFMQKSGLYSAIITGLILTSCANANTSDSPDASDGQDDEASLDLPEANWQGEGSGCPRDLFYPALNYPLYQQEC